MRAAGNTATICCLVVMSCSTAPDHAPVGEAAGPEAPPASASKHPSEDANDPPAREHRPSVEPGSLEPSSIRALAWSPDGASIIAGGDELSRWGGDPLQRSAQVTLDVSVDELSVGDGGVLTPCSPQELCIRRLDDLGVVRRLRCDRRGGEAGHPEWARWGPQGRWVAAHCVWHPRAALEGSETLSTCIWDGRTGQRVRCVAGTQPGYHRQPMDFSPSGTLAVSVLEGFELLTPPRFRRVGLVQEGAGAMDHSVFMGWSRSGRELIVLSDFGCALYRPGESEPIATFEPVGRLLAHATSSVVDETAVLYGEFVAIHADDGAIAARAETLATSGDLHWSHDGQLLAVAWQREGAAGFTVYGRAGLQLIYAAERRGGETRVPVAWHPSESVLAYASGSGVDVHQFGPDSELP